MRNVINYYYNLNPNKINSLFEYYYFYYNNELYYLYPIDNEDVRACYELNKNMLKLNVLVNEMVLARDNSIVIFVNNRYFVLMKVFVNLNALLRLSDISYLSNLKVKYPDSLMRSNWVNLWADKIDYLEYHHEHNFTKNKLLNSCFDYFIGLSENAISYLNQAISIFKPEIVDYGVISHNKILIDDNLYTLYNPLNIIIDHRARDVSEYIKWSFFNDNFRIYDELDLYFKNNYFSIYGIHLLLSRVLYPSFYFDLYDDIIFKNKQEIEVNKICSRINEYEEYLSSIWKYFHKYYNIIDIEWLNKKRNSI